MHSQHGRLLLGLERVELGEHREQQRHASGYRHRDHQQPGQRLPAAGQDQLQAQPDHAGTVPTSAVTTPSRTSTWRSA